VALYGVRAGSRRLRVAADGDRWRRGAAGRAPPLDPSEHEALRRSARMVKDATDSVLAPA
jgi:hypothetical protein